MVPTILRRTAAVCLFVLLVPAAIAQAPLRIFLRGGPKTHGPGEHDHPAFVAEWEPLLESRGAEVEGALRFPTKDELARTDVLVMYAAEAGSIHGEERANLEAFLARGGGIVAIHDAVCGDDPQWFKTVIGGAWEHGHAKWATGTTDLYVRDFEHPITKTVANWRFEDELYTELHMMPEAHVLMAGFQDVFTISPQMWTYEEQDYRAFVAIQGHYKQSFEHDAWRTLLLRGIAWAGKRDVESLTTPADLATLAYPTGGPLRPEAARTSLVLHEGFEASLVAAEPLIANPISLDWDPRGRLWVAETPGYPMKERFSGVPAHDSISVLEDTDGDGVMDKKTVFADGLDLVTSFVFHRDGVIALAAPDILFLRDTDGDGVCDKREVLFTGFGFGDTHAVMSNARWGLDGWIYATQGYSGGGSTDVRHPGREGGPDGERHFGRIGNGIFRFQPDGSAIEIVSSYGSNTWGLDFTPEGELFFSMANGAHLRHVVVPEKALARARLPGVETWADVPDHDRVVPIVERHEEAYRQIDFVGGFTAASGCCVYDGGAWPAEYEGRIYVAEPTVNLVHEDVLAPNGVTFTATKSREQEFLASADLWFRPVHMRVGPEGAMYVLDFYNQAAVHNDTRGPQHGPTNAALRPDRDRTHGRIWKVQHRAAKDVAAGELTRNDGAALAAALGSANGWRRGTALRLLCESTDPAPDSLFELMAAGDSSAGRIAAMWALARKRELGAGDVSRALDAADIAVRKSAIAVSSTSRLARQLEEKLWELTVVDAEPRLATCALTVLCELELNKEYGSGPANVFETVSNPPVLRSLALACAASAPLEEFAAARIPRRENGRPVLIEFQKELASVVARRGDPELEGSMVRMIGENPTEPALDRALLERLVGLSRSTKSPRPSPELRSALSKLLASSDFELAAAAMAVASRWGDTVDLKADIQSMGERFEREAADPGTSLERRLVCVRTLLDIADRRDRAAEIAGSILTPGVDPVAQRDLVEDLGGTDALSAASVLARRFNSLPAAARDGAFQHLIRRASWSETLLAEIEAGRIVPNDLGPLRISQLRNHGDSGVAKRATALFDKLQGAQNLKTEELIAQVLPIVEQPGDAVRGKELFRQNCATCHTYHGEGAKIGPDLTGMGAHGARALLPVILDPNASVEAAYLEHVCETTDERLITGIVVRDTPQSVVLRSTSGDTEIPRDEIVSLKSTGRSPMPVGLESIGPEGLRDVLAYLTGEFSGFRVLDLRLLFNASTRDGMYDPEKAPDRMELLRTGVIDVDGVPFELRDPATSEGGRNALCLKGGMRKDWRSCTEYPKHAEIPVGFAFERLHVLGGIGAWCFPIRDDKQPCVKWTWVYADGAREEVVLHDGVEFADWIGRRDVPGSKYVEDLVKPDSFGQLRTFSLAPKERKVVARIELESFDNHMSPTFVGLTAELAGAVRKTVERKVEPVDVLVVGGGSSHDFAQWFDAADLATLKGAGLASARYTESTTDLGAALPSTKVLVLTNNQPLSGDELRATLARFFDGGGGLVLVHPATWYNWADWPEYNARWVGGGARNHERYGEFEVRVVDPAHALARGVPATFRLKDELYETALDPAADCHVIAIGKSLATGREYPVLWIVARAKGRTACLTLGHDGAAHGSEPYKALYANAVRWVMEGR